MEQTRIVVIGAGVIGLTTALTLKKRGWKNVKIIAKYTPGDMAIEYTSPYAGKSLDKDKQLYKQRVSRCTLEDNGAQ